MPGCFRTRCEQPVVGYVILVPEHKTSTGTKRAVTADVCAKHAHEDERKGREVVRDTAAP